MNETRKNYLGLDWGASKIGVALAHEETRLAMAYGILPNDEKFLDTLGALFEQEGIGTVVIGIHKSDTYQDERAGEQLGQEIATRFQVVVEYYDEMFTSKMAQDNLVAQGHKHVSKHDDAEAASILLQSFLDRRSW